MTTLRLNANDIHEVEAQGRRLLFHVPTTSLFELDDVGGAVLDLFRDRPEVGEDDVRRRFDGVIDADTVVEAIQDFQSIGILRESGRIDAPAAVPAVERFPLSTVILNVTTGCNLSCTYCYKEDLTTPAKSRGMAFGDAVKAVDMLIRESGDRKRVNVVFFGGEPLTNLPLIRQVVDYAETRGAEAGKAVDFTMTTNATLLNEELVDWLDAHRFGLTISMDGYREVHDRNRVTVGGKGTYDVVARNVRMLLSRYRSRPVGARVTLTAGITDVVGIHRHLRDELGFFEVGFAPATSSDITFFNLDDDETGEVFEGFRVLGEDFIEQALKGVNTGFANMRTLLKTLHEGARKAVPCGAGLALLSVDAGGKINLCHRFTGSDMPDFGNVDAGIDRIALGAFISQAAARTVDPANGCSRCRIRQICAGGCYHESHAKYGDALHPVYHFCDRMREWVDQGIKAYARIRSENPDFLERHIEPRTEFLQ